MIGGHKVVELRSKIGILGILAVKPFEKMIVGLEPQGERTVCPFSGTLVVVLFEPCSQRVDSRNGGAGAVFKRKCQEARGWYPCEGMVHMNNYSHGWPCIAILFQR